MKFAILLSAAAMASPAFAGNPQSTGLTHTLAVHHEARNTVTLSNANGACLQAAADRAAGLPGLRKVVVSGDALRATFASADRAAEASHELNAAAQTCTLASAR